LAKKTGNILLMNNKSRSSFIWCLIK